MPNIAVPAHTRGLKTKPVAQSATEPAISVNISNVPVSHAAGGNNVAADHLRPDTAPPRLNARTVPTASTSVRALINAAQATASIPPH